MFPTSVLVLLEGGGGVAGGAGEEANSGDGFGRKRWGSRRLRMQLVVTGCSSCDAVNMAGYRFVVAIRSVVGAVGGSRQAERQNPPLATFGRETLSVS